MDIKIMPSKLAGTVNIPPSKSQAHRLIIASALSKGVSKIKNVYMSKDITATAEAMRTLGAKIEINSDVMTIRGIENPPEKAVIDCFESGSTLRFLIPAVCALGVETTFLGSAKLPTRPITPYLEELPKHGIEFDYNNTMPFTVRGKLQPGEFNIDGGISSQFITGLLLALPLLDGDSRIILTSHLQSRPYVDITIDCLKRFGVDITEKEGCFEIKGGQSYDAAECAVEGDYSQAAFFIVANALGSNVNIMGLNVNSFQGDKKIVEICEKIVYNKNGGLKPFKLDCSDIPDLVPILAVLGSFCEGRSYIENAARLRIKESDRLAVTAQVLNALGGKVSELDDGLVIDGAAKLRGGEIDAHNDHRIPMSIAAASTRSEGPVIIRGAECVAKSYPDFFEVFESLGGRIEKI